MKRERTLAVVAVEAIRQMRGGSQSQLMLDQDGRLWIVKFRNNPQGIRTLANELIATRLAEALGLPVPATDIVEVPESLVTTCPGLRIEHARRQYDRCLSGQQFGSAFVGGSMPGLVVDSIPEDALRKVRNLETFAGILAFDKWTGNRDSRQVVFSRTLRETRYKAFFIDFGFCFNANDWSFPDRTLQGTYGGDNEIYSSVTGWESFEPWLSRIEAFEFASLVKIAEAVPPSWYDCDALLLERLLTQLMVRRDQVRDLIVAFRNSIFTPFPFWE